MIKPDIQIGCQTYTWEMLGAGWTGQPEDLVKAIAKGGYAGIEITNTLIGHFADRGPEFARLLADAGINLVAFALSTDSGYCEADAVDSDLETTKRWVDYIAQFPGAVVSMGSATKMSDGARSDKLAVAAEVYNRAAEIGQGAGVGVAVHPSSHHNTLLFDRDDYDQLFAQLEPNVGWVPDTGHILRGKLDIIDTMTTYSDRIRYIHLKDVNEGGEWAMLGKGVCDTVSVIDAARSARNFNGWLVIEEESDTAAADPADAVRVNRETMRELGY